MLSESRKLDYKRVEAISKFQSLVARGATTFCNEFTQACSFVFGIDELAGKLARDIHLNALLRQDDWRKVGLAESQDACNAGFFVIAVYSTPEPGGDHVCVIVPGEMQDSGSWGCKVPLCANVGKSNFYGKPLSFAFTPAEKPELFVYHGEIK